MTPLISGRRGDRAGRLKSSRSWRRMKVDICDYSAGESAIDRSRNSAADCRMTTTFIRRELREDFSLPARSPRLPEPSGVTLRLLAGEGGAAIVQDHAGQAIDRHRPTEVEALQLVAADAELFPTI